MAIELHTEHGRTSLKMLGLSPLENGLAVAGEVRKELSVILHYAHGHIPLEHVEPAGFELTVEHRSDDVILMVHTILAGVPTRMKGAGVIWGGGPG